MKIRDQDAWGNGHYGATRGTRTHNGVDLVCVPDEPFLSPLTGLVTKVGYPYGDPERRYIRYVEITSKGHKFRFFYLNPLVKVGDNITKNDIIGTVISLQRFYPNITEHVHFEIINQQGEFIDPTSYVGFI